MKMKIRMIITMRILLIISKSKLQELFPNAIITNIRYATIKNNQVRIVIDTPDKQQ